MAEDLGGHIIFAMAIDGSLGQKKAGGDGEDNDYRRQVAYSSWGCKHFQARGSRPAAFIFGPS